MKQQTVNLIMMVGMFLAIALLAFTVVILIQNTNEIKTNGVSYAINKYDFNSCTCYDKLGKSINFNSQGVVQNKIDYFDLE